MFHFVQVSTSALGFSLSNFEVVSDVLLNRDSNAITQTPLRVLDQVRPLNISEYDNVQSDSAAHILRASRNELAAARRVLAAQRKTDGDHNLVTLSSLSSSSEMVACPEARRVAAQQKRKNSTDSR